MNFKRDVLWSHDEKLARAFLFETYEIRSRAETRPVATETSGFSSYLDSTMGHHRGVSRLVISWMSPWRQGLRNSLCSCHQGGPRLERKNLSFWFSLLPGYYYNSWKFSEKLRLLFRTISKNREENFEFYLRSIFESKLSIRYEYNVNSSQNRLLFRAINYSIMQNLTSTLISVLIIARVYRVYQKCSTFIRIEEVEFLAISEPR